MLTRAISQNSLNLVYVHNFLNKQCEQGCYNEAVNKLWFSHQYEDRSISENLKQIALPAKMRFSYNQNASFKLPNNWYQVKVGLFDYLITKRLPND